MKNKIYKNTDSDAIPDIKRLMKLKPSEIRDIFEPIFSNPNSANSKQADEIMDELWDLTFSIEKIFYKFKIKLFGLYSNNFNPEQLYCYLLKIQMLSVVDSYNYLLDQTRENSNEALENFAVLQQGFDSGREQFKSISSSVLQNMEKQLKQETERLKQFSDNGKKSNPTPDNAVSYFYTCVDIVLELDLEQQLYQKEVSKLARELLIDRETHYPIQWKTGKPFSEAWFLEKLRDHTKLPQYLKGSTGKKNKLRKSTLKAIKEELGL